MEEQVRFTPGPWQAARSDPAEEADVWWICTGYGNHHTEIATVPGGCNPHHEANAALIAAAPDLYEALRELVDLKAMSDSNGPRAVYEERKPIAWEAARAALSRAHPKASPHDLSEQKGDA